MANTFVSLSNLQYYDSKLKAVAVGSGSISGRTITLKAIDGTVVGTIEIPQTVYNLADSTQQGLMSAEMFVKVEGIAEGATKTEESTTNGQLLINGEEVKVFVHPTGQALTTAGFYKITTDAEGHVQTGAPVTKDDIVALGIPAQDTTYSVATTSADGLMSKADKAKLDGVKTNATKVEASSTNGNIKIDDVETQVYKHEEFTERASNLYKITVNAEGHVSAATAVQKSDITALGIPGQDTTYDVATADQAGLESAAHFSKVEGIEAGAQVNDIETITLNGSALPINSKTVNLDLTDYVKKADVASALNYCGSVPTFDALPTDAEKGDMYNVVAKWTDSEGVVHAAGTNVAWNGTSWDAMASVIECEAISNDEIDALFA